MNIIEQFEKDQIKSLVKGKKIPQFHPGDTLVIVGNVISVVAVGLTRMTEPLSFPSNVTLAVTFLTFRSRLLIPLDSFR